MTTHAQALNIIHEGCMIPALPLTLDKDGKWDKKRQRAIIRYYLDAGVDGIAVAVHTTQFEIRQPEIGLYEPLLQLAEDEIDTFIQRTGKTIVKIAGVCGPIEQAVNEAAIAAQNKYDAVLLSPGGLGGFDEDYLVTRTKAVAEKVPVIGFYLQTAVGGRRLSFDYWKKICEIDNVVAIKAASFDRYLTSELVRAVAASRRSDEITLYTGNDDNIVVDLLTEYNFLIDGKKCSKRFQGGLLGHWAVWTAKSVEIFRRIKECQKNDYIPSELLTLAAQITDANSAFFDTINGFSGCIAGIHEILRRQGLMDNINCLNPQEALSSGQLEEIDRVYKMYPHLNDDTFVNKNIEKWLA